jgi:putative redox protein
MGKQKLIESDFYQYLSGQFCITLELQHKSHIMTAAPDKSKELITSINLLNNKLHFEGTVYENDPVHIDYTPPLGDNLGYTSLELFLLSLSSCLGSSVLTFLRKMNKKIDGLKIISTGIRKQEHPTAFKSVSLHLKIKSPDAQAMDIDKVIKLSEDTYCPVLSMIKGNVQVTVSYSISRE